MLTAGSSLMLSNLILKIIIRTWVGYFGGEKGEYVGGKKLSRVKMASNTGCCYVSWKIKAHLN